MFLRNEQVAVLKYDPIQRSWMSMYEHSIDPIQIKYVELYRTDYREARLMCASIFDIDARVIERRQDKCFRVSLRGQNLRVLASLTLAVEVRSMLREVECSIKDIQCRLYVDEDGIYVEGTPLSQELHAKIEDNVRNVAREHGPDTADTIVAAMNGPVTPFAHTDAAAAEGPAVAAAAAARAEGPVSRIRVELEEKLRSELECAICHDMLRSPVMLKCGHMFCSECICRSDAAADVSPTQYTRCALCRGISKKLKTPPLTINNILDIMK